MAWCGLRNLSQYWRTALDYNETKVATVKSGTMQLLLDASHQKWDADGTYNIAPVSWQLVKDYNTIDHINAIMCEAPLSGNTLPSQSLCIWVNRKIMSDGIDELP